MAQARDGSFSCRASALRIASIEPFRAGDNPSTANDPLDASDPCEPGRAGLSDYAGPAGCYRFDTRPPGVDPNCANPNRVGTGVIYATTEECSNNRVETTPNPFDPVTPDECSSTPGHVDLQGKNATPREGQGVKSRAGILNLFLTDGSSPPANFLHLSVVNAFAEVTCRPNAQGQLVPVWDARSQVVFANVAGQLVVDLIPGLIPGVTRSMEPHLNKHATAGPFQFNGTFANENEPGGKVGPNEGLAQPVDPVTGEINFTDADRFTPGDQPVTRITQRAVDFRDGTVVAGEATADVTRTPCSPARPPGPRIVIDKVTTPQPDATAFDFTFNPGNQAFTLRDADPPREFNNLAAGNYTVTEAERAGYTTTVQCTDPSGGTTTAGRTANIRLDGTETVTCTFTNTRVDQPVDGQITIRKNTVPNDPQDFRFRGNPGPPASPAAFTDFRLDDDGNPTLPSSRTFPVRPGAYTVVEGPQDGFRLTAINCTDPTGNSRGNAGTATAMIDVAPGESVTCTFVNQKE
ncbi:MAG: hypothetical protein M3141_09280, partial [Actinomycetota bacterium]|nr:hypothetical protein [Actinomycetota bacterium]